MLKAYETLMLGLLDAPGHYRSGGVGVGGAEGLLNALKSNGTICVAGHRIFQLCE